MTKNVKEIITASLLMAFVLVAGAYLIMVPKTAPATHATETSQVTEDSNVHGNISVGGSESSTGYTNSGPAEASVGGSN